MGAKKNRLIETVLLSTHNICFGWEIRKIIFKYTLFSWGLMVPYLWILFTPNILFCWLIPACLVALIHGVEFTSIWYFHLSFCQDKLSNGLKKQRKFLFHLQPGNYQVRKEVAHELKFGDIAVMQI